ncbi:DUF2786 domain-containing protein [Pseudonocardia sp. CA-107938]|uniref:DUF2786 domain-containing protein n=1 Tax=Pseudonocardia sp. CA-107938 TaxID=3240021 RepID=UPI003D8D8B64
MSRRNREKRAAKQKARQRSAAASGRSADPGPAGFRTADDRAVLREAMIDGIRRGAVCTCDDIDGHAAELVADFGAEAGELDAATDTAVTRMVGEMWRRGWQPFDLVEIVRRRLDREIAEYVAEAVVLESRRYAAAAVHPRWRAQVAGIEAGAALPEPGRPHVRTWRARAGLAQRAGLGAVLRMLSLICRLPVFERLLPLPGESRHHVGEPAQSDQKALAKVRALLAKAESTQFPEEAEALSAKAQELMSRYSLHQAVHDHDRGRAPVVSGRRIWLEAPYLDAKALLVQEVAGANRARTVWASTMGFATVVGADADLDAIELLTTSLLVQAGRAMLAEGSRITRAGTSRTRSFRQSFLIAYARRIGERLAAADSVTTEEIDAEVRAESSAADSTLLPVLAARASATDALVEELFPHLVARGYSVSNADGWAAGRAAADQAHFGVRGSIAG